MCGREWGSFEEFIKDPSIQVLGLQAVPVKPEVSVVVFNHDRCGGISVKTAVLREVLGEDGPAEGESQACDGCFRDIGELARCKKACVVAAERRVALKVFKLKGRLR
jgi:hypothetical protein